MKSFHHIANLVRNARIKKDISQQKLSEILGYKNGQFVSNLERALCSLPLEKAEELSNALDLPIQHIKDALVEDYKSHLNAFVGVKKNARKKL